MILLNDHLKDYPLLGINKTHNYSRIPLGTHIFSYKHVHVNLIKRYSGCNLSRRLDQVRGQTKQDKTSHTTSDRSPRDEKQTNKPNLETC